MREGFRRRRVRREDQGSSAGEEAAAEEDVAEPFDLNDFNVPLKEWLTQLPTKGEIKRRFRLFLDNFVAEGGGTGDEYAAEPYYDKVIDKMCAEGGQSLVISYLHLSRFAPTLAIWLADAPRPMLELFDAVAKDVVRARFPDYGGEGA